MVSFGFIRELNSPEIGIKNLRVLLLTYRAVRISFLFLNENIPNVPEKHNRSTLNSLKMSDYYVKAHANGRNKSQHCWAQQCWVLLVNNVGSVCISLKE